MRRSFFYLLVSGLLVCSLLCPRASVAQHRERVRHFDDRIWHQPYYRGPLKLIVSTGRTWYQGDLTKFIAGARGKSSIGIGASATVFPCLDAALETQYIRLTAVDQVPDRGLSFRSQLVELTLTGRYYLEKYRFDAGTDSREQARSRWWRPYLMVGVGGALWWAEAKGGPQVAVGTDSLGSTITVPIKSEQKYPAHTVIVPVGLGFALRFSPKMWILPEFSYRFTYTDNLDDVGLLRNGGSTGNDGYMQFALRFLYELRRSPKRLH
jgi:hypothetical protein